MERSYFDILNELKISVLSDPIPYQEKQIIEDQINILMALLWKCSAYNICSAEVSYDKVCNVRS